MGSEYSVPVPPNDPVRDGPWPYRTILSYYKISAWPVPELPLRMQQATWDILVAGASASPFDQQHVICAFDVSSTMWWDAGWSSDIIPRYMVGWIDLTAGWIILGKRTHSDFQVHPPGDRGHSPSLRLPRSALIPACYAEVRREMRNLLTRGPPDAAVPVPDMSSCPRMVIMQLGGREDLEDVLLVDRLVRRNDSEHSVMQICPLEQGSVWDDAEEGWHLEPIGVDDNDRPTPMELLQKSHVGGGLCTVLLNGDDDFCGALPLNVAFYRNIQRQEYFVHMEMLPADDHPGARELAELRRAWRRAVPPVAHRLVPPSFMGPHANGTGGPRIEE